MTNENVAGEIFSVSNYQFARGLRDLFAPGAGVEVGGFSHQNAPVEIDAPLPRQLRHGLKQAVAWDEPLSCGSRKQSRGLIVWSAGRLAFNIKNWGALVDLLAEVASLKGCAQ